MKKLLILLSIISNVCYGQNCNFCTQTINSVYSMAITVNSGDVLCITASGQMNGNIIINGGTVCNDGIINSNILFNDGIFNNYGSVTGTGNYFNHDKGVFNNYGIINNGSYTAVGSDISITNYNRIQTGFIDLDSTTNGTRPVFLNEGVIYTTNLTVERTDFTNNDSITLTGNLVVGVGGFFYNSGVIEIGGNCNVSQPSAYLHTNCMINVLGNWTNSGTVNGPATPCGGFTVNGFATNQLTGFVGTNNSYVDICEQGNPNGLLNNGTIGPNVTQCSCNNSCNTSTGINEQIDNSQISAYPNPVSEILTISSDVHFANYEYLIYNSFGEVVMTGRINENSISVSSLISGIYFIALSSNYQKYYARIVKI